MLTPLPTTTQYNVRMSEIDCAGDAFLQADDRWKMSTSHRLYGHCEQQTDWSYEKRRQMQEIIPGVFLGPFAIARKTELDNLKQAGITHIVCVRQDMEANYVRPSFPDDIRYLVLNIADKCSENIIQHIPKARDFIDECLQGGGKVLVHGHLGVCRSAAIVVGYVMEALSLSFNEALEHVQHRRYCIGLSASFVQQLQDYEAIYKAKKTFAIGSMASSGVLKRKREEIMDFGDCT